ncbi:hypothetical protein H072_1512 [Dactylellina haptotyla CBS 200.50]|uniref:Uncharacterized protein n=1 Tax=Dactylellina haptotyla (strain CBS 200.50) TaxID=1284197 RepID=S8BYB2_DACHA|nr:hypothetical protein H072_1512 [Dactylellina haptotyla CBS 200.50]
MPRKKADATTSTSKYAPVKTHNGGNLTLSDAYQGNLLLYQSLARYTQKILLERNITRVLAVQADLLRAEKQGRRVGGNSVAAIASRSVSGGARGTLDASLERVALVPDFDNGPTFGVMPVKLEWASDSIAAGQRNASFDGINRLLCECEVTLFCVNKDGEEEQMWKDSKSAVLVRGGESSFAHVKVKLERPFEIPLEAFAHDRRDAVTRLADAYEIRVLVKSGEAARGSPDLGSLSLVDARVEFLREPLVTSFRLDRSLRCTNSSSLPMKYQRTEDAPADVELTIKHAWSGRINFMAPTKKRKAASASEDTITVRSFKRPKTVQMEYTFRGSVKHFDDQGPKSSTKIDTNNKFYIFKCQGARYTCVICSNDTFKSLERLRFHLKNTHIYFAFALKQYRASKGREVAKIMVDPAVESTSSKPSLHHGKQQPFTWIRPRGYKAFNIKQYLEGDNSWTTRVGISEMERKMMNGPGRVCKRKGIVPKLVSSEENKRTCVVPERADGKAFVRFRNREEICAGDEVLESDDEVDESWLKKTVAEPKK